MAHWVSCTTTGDTGRQIFVNLDNAYAIVPTRMGSLIRFIALRTGKEGPQSDNISVVETPDQLLALPIVSADTIIAEVLVD